MLANLYFWWITYKYVDMGSICSIIIWDIISGTYRNIYVGKVTKKIHGEYSHDGKGLQ